MARTVVPSRKVTLPVGVPPDGDETVDVKVTYHPESDGFSEEANVAVVVALPTTCQNTFDVLAPKFESPP